MCKEDVRIGRKKTAIQLRVGNTDSNNAAKIMLSNPNRATVVIGFSGIDGAAAPDVILVYGGKVSGSFLGVLTQHQPQIVLTVEEYGDGCTGEIFVQSASAAGSTVFGSEFVWLDELEKL